MNTLGVAYYRLGQYDKAVQAFEEVGKLNAAGPTAWDYFFLAMCYQRLGEPDKARDFYVKATQWWSRQPQLRPDKVEELTSFRAEADALLLQPRGKR